MTIKWRLKSWHNQLFGLILTAGVLMGFAAYVELGDARPAAERNKCLKTIGALAQGVLAYEEANGQFPPPYIADRTGVPMHSWRILILPYCGYESLYDEYRFDEPWNGPNNSQLASRMPPVFRCPSDDDEASGSVATSYLAVTGPETIWPAHEVRAASDVTDGLSKTLMLMECGDKKVHWMSPVDISAEEFTLLMDLYGKPTNKFTLSSHQGILSVGAYADGHTQALSLGNSNAERRQRREIFTALFTVNGGEDIDRLSQDEVITSD